MWPNWQSSRKKEDLVKSGYRLDIKIKKFKNDDQSGPIFFLKNPLCVCVCENYIFQVEKCKKIAQEKPLLPVFLFLKTAGSLRFLNRRFSDYELFKKSGIDGCVFF